MSDPNKLTKAYLQKQVARNLAAAQQIASRSGISDGRVIPSHGDLPIHVGRRLDATVLFLDICKFSARPSWTASEQENLLRILSLFFSEMIRIVQDFGGIVEKNTGDGLMAYFTRVPNDQTAPQQRVVGIIHFLLYPNLSNPVLERPINEARKRIDITFDNTADAGVFARLRSDPFLVAREVMIECKNYTHDLANPELDQLLGRFDHRRGRFGIIACRDVKDRSTLVARCADAFRSQQGVIVVLTDADLKEALLRSSFGRETRMNEIIQNQLRDLLA